MSSRPNERHHVIILSDRILQIANQRKTDIIIVGFTLQLV